MIEGVAMKESSIFDIERDALGLLLKYRQESRMSETAFGKAAFPEVSNPRSKINSMWAVRTGCGKPLRLRLGDFCAMCKALKKDPSKELFSLWQKYKEDEE